MKPDAYSFEFDQERANKYHTLNMKLDAYSFELHQEPAAKHHNLYMTHTLSNCQHTLTMLTNILLLSVFFSADKDMGDNNRPLPLFIMHRFSYNQPLAPDPTLRNQARKGWKTSRLHVNVTTNL